MHSHRSDDVGRLVVVLARQLQRGKDPFVSDPVIAGSPGLARWLAAELANCFGVWANGHMPTLADWWDELWTQVLPDAPRPWSTDALPLAVADALLELGDAGPPLPNRTALHALATDIAHGLPRWSVYRKALVAEWERGAPGWQGALWRALCKRLGPYHPSAAAGALVDALPRAANLPRAAFFFDVDLDPCQLDVLDALGRRIDVHLFRPSPSPFSWEHDDRDDIGALATLGAAWRAADQRMANRQVIGDAFDLHTPVETDTRLQRLKASWRGHWAPSDADDDSFRLRSAPHPAREVEALRDALLHRFHADPTLAPQDVLVVSPQLDDLAPFVTALFADRIPIRIADRPRAATDARVAVVRALLDLPDGRMGLPAVLEVIALEPVRARFGLAGDDIGSVASALVGSGARWGMDASFRVARGEPGHDVHSLRHGLTRLLLAVAMPSDDRAWKGVVPRTHDLDADALGGLSAFVAALDSWCQGARPARPLAAWATDLAAGLLRFAVPGDDPAVHAALLGVAERAQTWSEPLTLAEAAPWIRAAVDGLRTRAGLLGGGVTFARPEQVRGVPARVIAWLGLDAASWPRRRPAPAWDPMSERVAHDPDEVAADRALVLGSALLARDAWWASWCAEEPGTRAPRLASSAALELQRNAERDGAGNALHVVAGRSWDDAARLADAPVADAWAVAAADAAAAPLSGRWVLSTQLEPETEALLDVEEFVTLVSKPARSFFGTRLHARPWVDTVAADDVDRLDADDGLERWSLRDRLLTHRKQGRRLDAVRSAVLASGDWPLGVAGVDLFDQLRDEADALWTCWQRYAVGTAVPRWIAASLPPIRVEGWLHGLYGDRRVELHAGAVRPEKEVAAWVRHLLACWTDPAFQTTTVIGAGDDEPTVVHFRRPQDPEALLTHWAKLALFVRSGRGAWLPAVNWDQPDDEDQLRRAIDDAGRFDADAERFWKDRALSMSTWQQASTRLIGPLRDHRGSTETPASALSLF